MKLKEGTFHIGIGPLKANTRKWTTYKAGDEVNPDHVEQLLLKGGVIVGGKVPDEQKPKLSSLQLYDLKKKDQVVLLKGYGLKSGEIRALNSEELRVNKILELQGD